MLVLHTMGGMTAGDPSYAAWRESAQGFLDPANQTNNTDTYAITRKAGP